MGQSAPTGQTDFRCRRILYNVKNPPSIQNTLTYPSGLSKTDIYQVQALSAYALVRLGDDSARNVLKKIAQLDLQFFSSDALNAAGKLGELGDASAFEIIVKGMESSDPLTRRVAVENVMSFVALQGETYTPGKTIDVWTIYAKALVDESPDTQSVALAQLEELNLPQAIPLLEKYLKRETGIYLKNRAEAILTQLKLS